MEGGHATRRTYRHIVQAEVLVVVPRSGVASVVRRESASEL